jgi:uncharacterized protein YifE (UPF0438 family)
MKNRFFDKKKTPVQFSNHLSNGQKLDKQMMHRLCYLFI